MLEMTYTIFSKKLGTTIEFVRDGAGGQVYTRELNEYSCGRWENAFNKKGGAQIVADGAEDFVAKCRRWHRQYIKAQAKKKPYQNIVDFVLQINDRGQTSAGWDFFAARARLLEKIGPIYARMCDGEEGLLADVMAAVTAEFQGERQYHLCDERLRETQRHQESIAALAERIHRWMRVSIARKKENIAVAKAAGRNKTQKVRRTHTLWSNKLDKSFRFSYPVGGGAITLDHVVGRCIPQAIGQGGTLRGEAIIAQDDSDFLKKVRRWYRQHLAMAQ
jgi:hypothetical protein